MSSASQRLNESRARLRQVLYDHAHPPAPRRSQGSLTRWLDNLQAKPGIGGVLHALRQWWDHHPVRAAGAVAVQATEVVVRPVAQRHPLVLLGGAVVVGAMLAWSRPWRRVLTPALVAGLLPQFARSALTQVPGTAWMSLLGLLARQAGPDRPARQSRQQNR